MQDTTNGHTISMLSDIMSHWTPEQSSLLSLLLDDVVGTPGEIKIRKDYCKIFECIISSQSQPSVGASFWYYSGSKGEGLYLAGATRT